MDHSNGRILTTSVAPDTQSRESVVIDAEPIELPFERSTNQPREHATAPLKIVLPGTDGGNVGGTSHSRKWLLACSSLLPCTSGTGAYHSRSVCLPKVHATTRALTCHYLGRAFKSTVPSTSRYIRNIANACDCHSTACGTRMQNCTPSTFKLEKVRFKLRPALRKVACLLPAASDEPQ